MLPAPKVLRDEFCEPWERVALRELKDFAVPLTVTIGEKQEIFWKWFTVSEDDAKGVISDALDKDQPKSPAIEEKAEEQQVLEPIVEIEQEKESVPEPPKRRQKRKKVEETQVTLPVSTLHSEDEFTGSVLGFFGENRIFIIEQKLVKRNREMNFIIEFPSVIGTTCFYAKAKSKKKISDKDLNDAFDEAKSERLPLLFMSNGEMTKKAQNFIANQMRGIVFRQL